MKIFLRYKTAGRKSVKGRSSPTVGTPCPQVSVEATLNDAEEILFVGLLVSLDASVKPAY